MSVNQSRFSLPYVILATVATGLLVGAGMLTVTDPVMQSLFGNPNWSSDVGILSDLLGWFVSAWNVVLPLVILFAILFEVWVYSRRGGP